MIDEMNRTKEPAQGWSQRFNSLFVRFLLTQTMLVLGLVLVFYALFMANRNATLAELYAERWAPVLARAAGLAVTVQPVLPVDVRTEPPVGSINLGLYAPRVVALRAALAERGVPVDAVVIGMDDSTPTVWLHVTPAHGVAQWLGMPGFLVTPGWSWRLALALGLGLMLLVGVSWSLTRWLTRPLEQLSTRISLHAPGRARANALQHAKSLRMSAEIAQIDAAFSDLLERQEQYERERTMLLAGVSHDLRSPLARIRLAAELLPDSPDSAPRRAAIIRNVGEADRLMESFLDFVRAAELSCDESVDLAAVARSVVASLAHSAHALSFEVPETLLYPRCNRLLMERLLANMLDNAFKHGRMPVRLRISQQACEVWLDVLDAGDGVPLAARSRMLEAFTRGDSSRSVPGSGLGLAIVQQVVSRMKGNVVFIDEVEWHGVRVVLPHPAA
ncbi:MAG: hypothetical protein B7Y40_02845 [Gammaproteobacteria bacterium 28-57-27]|nr:MAG: hypothetical protein B7Y40_02845 [Gammaproteobacteria bacterium 28-57-27]